MSLACATLHATFQMTVILIFTAVRNSDLITFSPTPCSGHSCQVKLVYSIFIVPFTLLMSRYHLVQRSVVTHVVFCNFSFVLSTSLTS